MIRGSNDIRLGENVTYTPLTGYVLLGVPDMSLAPIEYKSQQFTPKPDLHCSIVNVARLAVNNAQVGFKLLDTVRNFLRQQQLEFTGFTGDAYACRVWDGRQSILGLIGLNGVDQLYDRFRDTVPGLPDPVPHITTHTLNSNFGLAVPDDATLEERCTKLPEDVAAIWRAQVNI